MASIYRPSYTVVKNGKKVRRKSPRWHIGYTDAGGIRRRVKGYKDKTATAQLAAKLEKEAELADAGVVDKYAQHRRRPLTEHLADFRKNLSDKGNTPQHVNLLRNRVKAIVKSCGFTYIDDISASRVQSYLAERRRVGLSIQTSNFYLQAMKQFCRWLISDRRTADSPLAHLKGQNVKLDRRHDRRALELEELQRLLKAALAGPKHHQMTGQERAMLYKMAVNTALRANELATLAWTSLDLEGPEPAVTVLAGYSKHRREDLVYLPAELAHDLAVWRSQLRDIDNTAKVFPTFNPKNGARMLRPDLKLAGIPYKDDAGKVADFHSLRHTCATLLMQKGVDPKVVQMFVRHSTIGLTMDRYTHLRVADQRSALSALPTLPGVYADNPETQHNVAARKTGTDDLPSDSPKSACAILARTASVAGQEEASVGTENTESDGCSEDFEQDGKTFPQKRLGTASHESALVGSSERRGGDSNPRYSLLTVRRFSKPLL